jgi:hypothetical protein
LRDTERQQRREITVNTVAICPPAQIRDSQYTQAVSLERCILAAVSLDVADDDVIRTSVKLQDQPVFRPVAVKLPRAGELDVALRLRNLRV